VLYLPYTDTWSQISGVCLDLTKKKQTTGRSIAYEKATTSYQITASGAFFPYMAG
jgi:hypothetical protein